VPAFLHDHKDMRTTDHFHMLQTPKLEESAVRKEPELKGAT